MTPSGRRALLWCESRAVELLARLLPARPHVVVRGFPPTEGNAVEVVRALARRYGGRVHWMDAPAPAAVGRLVPAARRPVRTCTRRSLRGLWAYATAEAVLFTHPLYGDPAPAPGKAVVNLWHGDGFKVKGRALTGRGLAPATYVAGSTRLLTHRKALDSHLPVERALVVGNARTDQMSCPVDAAALHRLGIPAHRPFVLWMPTFRRTRQTGLMPGWTDGADGAEGADSADGAGGTAVLRELMAATARALEARGVTLVVKPHPLDASERSVPGARSVDDATLAEHGVPLYALLGGSAGLVTDFSSTLTDYLLLDRPIGVVFPDAERYARGRGLWPPDVLEWLPGRRLVTPADAGAFADEVAGDGAASTAALRAAAAECLGLVRTTTAADDLLDALVSRGELSRGGVAPREEAATA